MHSGGERGMADWVITLAACAGVPEGTGATPTETALLIWAY